MAITHIPAEMPFVTALAALPDRVALQLFAQLAHERFSSNGHAYDRVEDAIRGLAAEMAADEGFRGDDLASRYLAPTWPATGLAHTLQVAA
jgi:hypothetical protein